MQKKPRHVLIPMAKAVAHTAFISVRTMTDPQSVLRGDTQQIHTPLFQSSGIPGNIMQVSPEEILRARKQ